MKNPTVCLISLLLLFGGCNVEENPRFIFTGDGNWYTVQVNMEDNWKIFNAQLEADRLHLELDIGKGREKLMWPLLDPIENFNEDVTFRGISTLDEKALLHFTIEDKQQAIGFPRGGHTHTSESQRRNSALAVFRVGKRLFVDLTVENTGFGNLLSHDLQKHYFGGNNVDQFKNFPFSLSNGVFKIDFGKNHKENRTIPIKTFIEPNDTFGSAIGHSMSEKRKLRWTYLIELDTKKD